MLGKIKQRKRLCDYVTGQSFLIDSTTDKLHLIVLLNFHYSRLVSFFILFCLLFLKACASSTSNSKLV